MSNGTWRDVRGHIGENRFFISMFKEDGSKEILTDASLEKGSEISIQRPILCRHTLKVIGELELGRQKQVVSNKEGKLLHSKLAVENASNGDLLGFNYDKCATTKPKDFIYLKPNNPVIRTVDEIEYSVEEFENKTHTKSWQFPLPSIISSNVVNIQFYFLNTSNKMNNVEFNYSLNILEDTLLTKPSPLKKYEMKVNKTLLISPNILTYIVFSSESDINIKNKLCNLILQRNKNHSSIDSLQDSIYLIGIKIEFDTNFFNKNI